MRRVLAVALALAGLGGASSAATLTLQGTGTATTLPGGFNLDDRGNGAPGWTLAGYQALVPAGVAYDGSVVRSFGADKGATDGLSLSSRARVTFTYLGYEAGIRNSAVAIGDTVFTTTGSNRSAFGAIWQGIMGPGMLDFGFLSSGGQGGVANDGVVSGNDPNIRIGYARVSDSSYAVLFNDRGGDFDYDDIGMRIDVAAVPLPAALPLLLGAVGALAALRRRKAA